MYACKLDRRPQIQGGVRTMRNEEMGQFLVLNLSIDSNSIDCGQVLTWNDHLIKKFDP